MGDFGAGFPGLKPEWRGWIRSEVERIDGMSGADEDLVDDRSGWSGKSGFRDAVNGREVTSSNDRVERKSRSKFLCAVLSP